MSDQKSDLSRAFSEDGALKTHVGGQALLEGVMMRGKHNWAVAVREPEGGIYTEEHDFAYGKDKSGWLYRPFIRGCRAFVESLVLSYKALTIAVEHAFTEEEEDDSSANGDAAKSASISASEEKAPTAATEVASTAATAPMTAAEAGSSSVAESRGATEPSSVAESHSAAEPPNAVEEPKKSSVLSDTEMAISMIAGLVLGVVLFVVAPAFFTNLIVGEYDSNTLLWNIVDGVLRIAVFILYIWLIGRMSDIKRMFGYHGAEHKAIHCYEHGLEMTPENARKFPRLHVRCGTAFLIMVMILAIFIYTITPLDALISAWGVPSGAPKLALVIVVRILLMPVIAGVAYEITVRWAGSHPDNLLVKIVLWPGMQMQYLTTNEPDDGQIECAIAAMKMVLAREEAEEEKARASVAAVRPNEA